MKISENSGAQHAATEVRFSSTAIYADPLVFADTSALQVALDELHSTMRTMHPDSVQEIWNIEDLTPDVLARVTIEPNFRIVVLPSDRLIQLLEALRSGDHTRSDITTALRFGC